MLHHVHTEHVRKNIRVIFQYTKRNQVPKFPIWLQLISTNTVKKKKKTTPFRLKEVYGYGWKSKHSPLKNMTIFYNKQGWIPKKVKSEAEYLRKSTFAHTHTTPTDICYS